MNLDLTPEVLAYSVSAVFGAGGFYSLVKSHISKSTTVDAEQQETLAEIARRVSKLENKQASQDTMFRQFEILLNDQRESTKELTRCVNTIEKTVSKLTGLVDLLVDERRVG